VDGDDETGGGLALPGFCVGIEISGGEDANIFGVKDRFHKTREESLRVLREEGNCEGVDGELGNLGN